MNERAQVWVMLIVGQNREPFLEAALRSVDWADGFAVVNTDPWGEVGRENEAIVRGALAGKQLRYAKLHMDAFDFAKARNTALEAIPQDAYVFIVDADDVHYPSFRDMVWGAILDGHDIIGAHYWHHCVYKDLWHSQPHRWLVFRHGEGVRFQNTQGNVHEELIHPRTSPYLVPEYSYHHYGYIKPAAEVAARWEFYRTLGAPVHEYDVSQPDRALDAWPDICHPYPGEHPPAVREVLEGYPTAPIRHRPDPTRRKRVGLVLLTWDDEENLRPMLDTLALTTEPFELVVIDNGSLDGTLDLLSDFAQQSGVPTTIFSQDPEAPAIVREPLAVALNRGFGHFLDREDLDFIGWIHPDHVFEWSDWLSQLLIGMDENPEYAKLGATEAGNAEPQPRAGNTQCYIVRRSALQHVGLFNEAFEACGGYEDWEANRRLLEVGRVMIWPGSVVRHKAMQTRARHDNVEAGKRNADLYHKLTGQWEPFV